MKKILLTCICGSLLALTASMAVAAPLHLKWDNCGPAGVGNKDFACNSNAGTNNAYGSYIAPAGVNNLTGMSARVGVTAGDGSLPAWWQYGAAPACRLTALTGQYNTACGAAADYWGSVTGGPSGSFNYTYNASGADMSLVCAVDGAASGPVDAGTEYYAFTLRMTNVRTVGTPSCEGCLEPICLSFYYLQLTQPAGAGDFVMTDDPTPSNLDNNASWQGGAACLGTPVQNRTWGSVKSLYR